MTERVVSALFLIFFLYPNGGSATIKPLPPGCKTAQLDVAFLIDSSRDVTSSSLRQYKRFVKRTIEAYDVTATNVRPVAVMYGGTAKALNSFDEITGKALESIFKSTATSLQFSQNRTNKSEIIDIVNNASPVRGVRRLGKALLYVCDDVFGMSQGIPSKAKVPKVIVVISGGRSYDKIPEDLSCFDQEGSDVTIIGVGVGRNGINSLKSKFIKSPEKLSLSSNLLVKDDDIAKRICLAAIKSCESAYVDLMFLIDSENTTPTEQRQTLDWVQNLIGMFDVGVNKTRIGYHQSTENSPTHEFELNSFQLYFIYDDRTMLTNSDILNYFSKQPEHSNILESHSQAHESLNHILRHSFSFRQGSRDTVPQILIYITNKVSNDTEELKTAVENLRFSGVDIFAVGVGQSISRSQLREIASQPAPQHLSVVQSYDDLYMTENILMRQICNELHPGFPYSVLDLEFMIHTTTKQTADVAASNFDAAITTSVLKEWLKTVVDAFYIGPHYTKIGLSTFGGDKVYKEINMTDENKEILLGKIDRLDTLVRNGDANIGMALKTFDSLTTRKVATQVVLLLTDSNSADSVTEIVNELRENGTIVVAVGLGNRTTIDGLEEVAYDSSSVIQLPNGIVELKKFTSQISSMLGDTERTDCGEVRLDVEFLLDGSTSINPTNFAKVKEWVKSLSSSFDIRPYLTRVGVNQYSTNPQTEFTMAKYDTKKEVVAAICEIDYLKGYTYIGKAMNYTRQYSFTAEAGSRAGVNKVLIVMTDGVSQDSISEAAKLMHDFVKTYAVGVGEIDLSEIKEIASDPDSNYAYQVDDFDAINSIRGDLVNKVCGEGHKRDKIVCPSMVADVVLLLDTKIGLKPHAFKTTKKFFKQIFKSFPVGPNNTQIALYEYDNTTKNEFTLSQYQSTRSLLKALNAVRPDKTATLESNSNLGSALSQIKNDFENQSSGTRPNIPKAVLVITSSESTDAIQEAASQLLESGVNVFAVGIGGKINEFQIQQIVSLPLSECLFKVRHFPDLLQIQEDVSNVICKIMAAECREQAIDVGIFVDDQIDNADFPAFVSEIKSRFDVGESDVRFALQTNTTIDLYDEMNGKPKIIPEVTFVSAVNQYTNDLFWPLVMDRPNVQKVMVLVTNQSSQYYQHISDAIFEARGYGLDVLEVPYSIYQETKNINLMSSKLTQQICEDSQCPFIERNRELHKGFNLVNEFGLPNGNVAGVKEVKGTYQGSSAYRINGRQSNLVHIKMSIFPGRCPSQFTTVSVIKKLKGTSDKSVFNLMSFENEKNITEFQISFNVPEKSLVIRIADDILKVDNRLIKSLFNKKWHKLEVIVGLKDVTVYLDCRKVGNYDASIKSVFSRNGNVIIGQNVGRPQTMYALQDLVVKCHNGMETTRPEMCCELKKYQQTDICSVQDDTMVTNAPATTRATTSIILPGDKGPGEIIDFSTIATIPQTEPTPTDVQTTTPESTSPKPTTTTTTVPGPTTTTTTTPEPTTTTRPEPTTTTTTRPEPTTTTTTTPEPTTTTPTTPEPTTPKPTTTTTITPDPITATTTKKQTIIGLPGPPGPIGPPGAQGPQGKPGNPGAIGPRGESGYMGIPGFPGEKGGKGEIGKQGPTGPPGSSGNGEGGLGVPGPKGEKGDPGSGGNAIMVNGRIKGITKGVSEQRVRQIAREILLDMMRTEIPRLVVNMIEENGRSQHAKRGLPGPQGERGFTGSPGPRGSMGQPGDRGIRGVQGASGIRGLQGFQGERGEKGDKGLSVKGKAGNPGIRGPPGQSIMGRDGRAGLPGAQGLKGDMGIMGYQGLQGMHGSCDVNTCRRTVIDIMQRNGHAESYSSHRENYYDKG